MRALKAGNYDIMTCPDQQYHFSLYNFLPLWCICHFRLFCRFGFKTVAPNGVRRRRNGGRAASWRSTGCTEPWSDIHYHYRKPFWRTLKRGRTQKNPQLLGYLVSNIFFFHYIIFRIRIWMAWILSLAIRVYKTIHFIVL